MLTRPHATLSSGWLNVETVSDVFEEQSQFGLAACQEHLNFLGMGAFRIWRRLSCVT